MQRTTTISTVFPLLAVSGTVVTHHRHASEECSAGGVVGMRHAGMQITDRACHVTLKACAAGSILVSL